MIDSDEMQIVAAGRAKTYAILAALYSAPPAEDLAALIRTGGLVVEGGGSLRAAADALTESFRRAASDGLAEAELVAEHTRLFTLPSGVVPHESYYADENRRIGGHVTAAVKMYYDAAAAELTGACLELPDHVGVELEFMKFLCDLEAQFWQASNEEGLRRCMDFQEGFLADHLLRWYRELCEKIRNETSLEIYRALARLTVEFLEAEQAFVPDLTKVIHSERRNVCACES